MIMHKPKAHMPLHIPTYIDVVYTRTCKRKYRPTPLALSLRPLAPFLHLIRTESLSLSLAVSL